MEYFSPKSKAENIKLNKKHLLILTALFCSKIKTFTSLRPIEIQNGLYRFEKSVRKLKWQLYQLDKNDLDQLRQIPRTRCDFEI